MLWLLEAIPATQSQDHLQMAALTSGAWITFEACNIQEMS